MGICLSIRELVLSSIAAAYRFPWVCDSLRWRWGGLILLLTAPQVSFATDLAFCFVRVVSSESILLDLSSPLTATKDEAL